MTSRLAIKSGVLLLALTVLAGCASIPRVPFTKEQQAAATVPGIPNARVWSDDRVDVLSFDEPAQGRARFGLGDGEAIALQIFADGVADIRFVVTDNDVCAST